MKFSLYPERKQSPLLAYFNNVESKIELYEQHIAVTTQFYSSELEKKLLSVRKELELEKKTVEKAYEVAYQTATGTEDERHLIADEESGRGSMYDYYQYQEELWEEHYAEMFDYFNKSSVIMLYGLMESELKNLCIILKKLTDTRISIDDFKSANFIKGYFKYLDLVIEIPYTTLEKFNTKIEHLQFIRNKIAHNNSEISSVDDKEEKKVLKEVMAQSKKLLTETDDYLTGKKYLRIFDSAYVKHGYDLFKGLIHELFLLVNQRFGFTILIENLRDLFIPYCNAATFSVVKVDTVKGGMKFIVQAELKDEAMVPEAFMMNITVTGAKNYDVEVLNQVMGNDKVSFYVNNINNRKNLAIRFFNGWVEPSPKLKLQITFFTI
uniref:hypothetical protein n=1 Tax=Pedobacter schmidteae TaxID=2201271 RepID=UPI000EB32B2C|nr:hypothetical protein [Pedobacter schmidteae]